MILFGGVDTARYTGNLVVLPLQPAPGSNFVRSFLVSMPAIKLVGDTGTVLYSATTSEPALLDSGITTVVLPTAIFEGIVQGLGAQYTSNGYTVPCSLVNSKTVISFRLGSASGPIITSQISQFILQGNGNTCLLAILPSQSGLIILGDPFLRAAYVVYNIDGNSVAIANTNFNPSGSNIVPITNANTIPGAVPLSS
jgi:Eukaryotic aspartyl protease